MSNTNIKRQTIYIQRGFQGRSIAVVTGIIAASGLLSGVLLYLLLSSELSTELYTAHQQIKNVWESLASTVIFSNVITVSVTSVVAAIAVLYQSHKIAGPMTRLQRICEEVTSGNLNPVTTLRKADQLTALASAFETMVNSLQTKESEQQSILAESISVLNKIEQESDHDKQSLLISELQEQLSKLHKK